MAEAKLSLYEGLFLLNPVTAATDFSGSVEHVREMFSRADAELIVLRKWDERRLAFEIGGQKRGIFLLAYFKAAGSSIPHIERDVNLSEKVLRVLMIKADHMGEVELELAARDADLSLEGKLRSPGATPGREMEEAGAEVSTESAS